MSAEQTEDPLSSLLLQFEEPELFFPSNLPDVWAAAEACIAADLATRRQGVQAMIELGVLRSSPLAVYLFTTRLLEPDILLRIQIIQALAYLFEPDRQGLPAVEVARAKLVACLSKIGSDQIMALLQAADNSALCSPQVTRLLSRCAPAGAYLATLAADREEKLSIRRRAIYFIGQVGYLDALPILQKLQVRLEARLSGQQSFLEIPTGAADETSLLPDIQKAIEYLRAR